MGNSAGMAGLKESQAGFTYQQPYMLEELGSNTGVAVIVTRYGNLGLLINQSGYEHSRVNIYGFSYARMFGEGVAAALQVNYLSHNLNKGGVFNGFYAKAGVQIFPSEQFIVAFFVQNPEQQSISYPEFSVLLPVVYSGGFSWYPAETFQLMAEVEKEMEYDPVYKVGIELLVITQLYFRGGISGKPLEMAVGAGYKWRFLEFDVGFAQHSQLGLTTSGSIILKWEK
ncbi:hypothetical protein DMA11_02055 [Marinilabiliaceae bacterium JC017]|nr:hypothetical protein DMA11_02055 [Marinilabiliaceae bacterium JC017]